MQCGKTLYQWSSVVERLFVLQADWAHSLERWWAEFLGLVSLVLCFLGEAEVSLRFPCPVLTRHGVKTLLLPRGDLLPCLLGPPPSLVSPHPVPMRVRPLC